MTQKPWRVRDRTGEWKVGPVELVAALVGVVLLFIRASLATVTERGTIPTSRWTAVNLGQLRSNEVRKRWAGLPFRKRVWSRGKFQVLLVQKGKKRGENDCENGGVLKYRVSPYSMGGHRSKEKKGVDHLPVPGWAFEEFLIGLIGLEDTHVRDVALEADRLEPW